MKIGFKTGPNNWGEGKDIVRKHRANMCEMWFRVDRAKDYDYKFRWLKKAGVEVGLHYWGMCKNNFKPNIATNNRAIRSETLEQIKKTIDIGKEINCVYVNIHPGAQVSEKLSFNPIQQTPVWSDKTPPEESEKLCLSALKELNEYALQRDVLLLVETICRGEKRAGDRGDFYEPGNLRLGIIEEAAKSGINIANDLAHTATWAKSEGEDAYDEMKNVLNNFIKKTKERTKLLHVNTVSKPFNGTDSHDGVTPEDEKMRVFPFRDQLLDILSMFKDRKDVFAVLEPRTNMEGNYLSLVSMVDKL